MGSSFGKKKDSKGGEIGSGRMYNLVMLGIGGVGKSALTIQFVQDKFIREYDPTIEDSYRKQVMVDGKVAMLNIWDTAGQEEYEALQDGYIRDADGFVIVYSIVDRKSFDKVSQYCQKILRVRMSDHEPIVIIGNKCDLEENREVLTSEAQKIAQSMDADFFEASAKMKINVEESYSAVIRKIRKKWLTNSGR